ncbi:MAG: flippase [Candidatus Paceibacterota bacterium]|jgi:O-antigen/teichoic acid export membrane protein
MNKIIVMQEISIKHIKEVWNHAGFQKYFRNTGWLFISRIVSMIITFLTTMFIARTLGPGNFGQLNYSLSFVGVISTLTTLGVDTVLYRDLIKNPTRKNEYMGSAFLIKLIGGILTTVLVILSGLFLAENDVSKIIILILSGTFLFNAFQIIIYEFQAQVKSKYISIIGIFITLILNTLKVLVLVNDRGVIYLAAILLLESILYTSLYLYIYKEKLNGNIFEWKFNKKIAIVLLKDSWPIIMAGAFGLIYGRIDQVLIKHLMNIVDVGIYSSAVAITEVWYFLPNIITSSLFPAIVNAKITSEELYHSRMRKIVLLLLSISLSTAIITTIFAPFLINIIYGSAFMGASSILRIYVWSNVGMFLGILSTIYLIAENKEKTLAFITFIPMITNVTLNLLWIPKFGLAGSAYATLMSYSLGPISLLFFRETRNIFFKRN